MTPSEDKHFLYLSIYQRIKNNIHEGKIPRDTKLESIRQAALHQGVSTTTMEHAYNQLLIEGYIRSVPKKGFFVEATASTLKGEVKESPSFNTEKKTPMNLAQTKDMFEIERFRKIMNEVLSDDSSLYEPCLPSGETSLRIAISAHLRSERDVLSVPENIIVASGIQQLIIALGGMVTENATLAYLKPGFKRALHAFKLCGFSLKGYDSVEALLQTQPDLIYLSPSNLYPSGEVMPINERLAIIRHANEQDITILEDDYNHLFRYNAYQIPTLYSLSSKDNVVYVGSFSRSTLISLRMSYMVIPNRLLKHHDTSKLAQTVSKPEQLTMARFIEEGHYRRHLKRLSRLSKRKNDALKNALEPYMKNKHFSIYGLESNMHFVIHFTKTEDKKTLTHTLDTINFSYKTFEERPLDILVPYSGIPMNEMEKTMNKLFNPL